MNSAGLKTIAAFAQMGCGKDTMCDYLAKKLSKPKSKNKWQRGAFANAVKDTFCESFGFTREFVEEWKRKTEIPDGFQCTVRQALQKIGDGFREIKKDIWIDIALKSDDQLIISDGRYLNEAKKVREKNGVNILIYRSGYVNNDPNPSEASMRPFVEYCRDTIPDGKIIHSCLVRYPDGLEYFDLFLRNDGDLQSFYNKIDKHVVPYIQAKL